VIVGTDSNILRGVAVAGLDGHHDLTVADGKVVSLMPSAAAQGGFVTPLFADCHVHLDKTYTIGRIRQRGSARVDSLFDAIDLMEKDRPHWSADDLRARASKGLQAAYSAGVGTMRAHVDWTTPDVPVAWDVMLELKQEWRGRIHLEMAALVRGDIVLDAGEAIAARVSRDGGVLGAFFYRNLQLEERIETMFALAVRNELALDFHVDEGLDVEADGFSLIVEATRRHNMAGRVLCGHACSLSLRTEDELARVLGAAAEAGTALVALPTSNLYLQDRIGGRSPRRRGLAPVKEARAAGMTVMLASDNVGDAFYPWGDYDPLSILRLAAPVAHVEPASWLDAVTTLPAAWCGGATGGPLKAGNAADFILHAAADADDLVSRPQAHRVVYRDGRALPNSDWRLS
jgi:cytosine deaminase